MGAYPVAMPSSRSVFFIPNRNCANAITPVRTRAAGFWRGDIAWLQDYHHLHDHSITLYKAGIQLSSYNCIIQVSLSALISFLLKTALLLNYKSKAAVQTLDLKLQVTNLPFMLFLCGPDTFSRLVASSEPHFPLFCL